jgi:hypothetical protein
LQTGQNGYEGLGDTYISAWSPSAIHKYGDIMRVRPGVMHGLLRFNLTGAIPQGYEIVRAELDLYVTDQTNTNRIDLVLHELQRRFVGDESNWQQAGNNDPWEEPGAGHIPIDRSVALASAPALVGRWTTFDVTGFVRKWHLSSSTNFGVLIAATSPGLVGVSIASSESDSYQHRPRLYLTLALDPTPHEDLFLPYLMAR